jgi:hypothetical protein
LSDDGQCGLPEKSLLRHLLLALLLRWATSAVAHGSAKAEKSKSDLPSTQKSETDAPLA